MAEATQTEICSTSVDTTIEGWEELYQDWQDENVASFREMYGERVSTIHVTRVQDGTLVNNAVFTVYADLYPEEV